MGRSPCCSKVGLHRGPWTAREDALLTRYIQTHGEGAWRSLPKKAGLLRCGKSCRLRWMNYLRPDIKRGNIAPDEEDLILRLHKLLGNRWSLIAGRLPGRTDNEIKNYWNSHLSKRLNNSRRPRSATGGGEDDDDSSTTAKPDKKKTTVISSAKGRRRHKSKRRKKRSASAAAGTSSTAQKIETHQPKPTRFRLGRAAVVESLEYSSWSHIKDFCGDESSSTLNRNTDSDDGSFGDMLQKVYDEYSKLLHSENDEKESLAESLSA